MVRVPFFSSHSAYFLILKDKYNTMIEEYDSVEGYCKILGHFLTFEYCRSASEGLPCSKVQDCWFQHFPVQEFISKHYSDTEQKKFLQPPKPKIQSIAEILEQAQKRLNKKE